MLCLCCLEVIARHLLDAGIPSCQRAGRTLADVANNGSSYCAGHDQFGLELVCWNFGFAVRLKKLVSLEMFFLEFVSKDSSKQCDGWRMMF